MKYLKTFENNEESEFLASKEDIVYLFTDLSDNGWQVNVSFVRKLFDFKHTDKPILNFSLIPYIQVSISKPTPFEQRFNRSQFDEVQDLIKLKKSDEYQEMIEVASLRLDDFELYIQNQVESNKQLNILIYRKTDKNYIK